MNKKIFAVFALLVVVASISAVSAFDLGDIFGASEDKNVTIDGIDFNIPAGFEEQNSEVSNELIKTLQGYGFKTDGKMYLKDSTGVGLFVIDYSDFEVSGDEMLETVGGNATTIKGINGTMVFDESYMFTYEKDDCLVMISSPDKDIIDDFIIA